MTLERGLELLAGHRAWGAENGPSPKKSHKKAAAKAKPGDAAPTFTNNLVKMAATKKAAVKRQIRNQQPVSQRKQLQRNRLM